MAQIIQIDIRGKQKLKSLFKRVGRWPQFTREGMRDWGGILERDTKASATQARISRFTGTLWGKGIEWRQGPKSDHGGLFARKEYIQLDSMKPHFVNITKQRTVLLRWASRAGIPVIQTAARNIKSGRIKKYAVGVKPHPFIQRGYQRALPKLTPTLNKHRRKK